MSMMQTVSQPSDLSPQDMRRYFNWPPPLRPSRPARPKKKWPLKLFIGLIVIYIILFVLSAIFISFNTIGMSPAVAKQETDSFANVFTEITLVFIVAELALLAYMIYPLIYRVYLMIRKLLIAATPSPPAPTDQQYEDWVRSWQGPIRQYGMQKLGLDESDVLSRPLYVRSLVWPGSKWSKYYQSYRTPIIIKHGADGRPHSSINRYTFFYPTQHYIAVYIVDTNALDRVHFEGTRTYFYDDIVGVETSAIALNDGYVNYAMQHFELQVSNGQSVGATTYVHDLDVDQTVNALRTLLRDKKYGIQGSGYGYIGH
jgi:hypothetical protein